METKETLQEVVGKWKNGDIVWSAELGGLGPGYEQAIQVLLWEILARWGDRDLPQDDGENYPEEYKKHVGNVVEDLNKKLGFSGAQVGSAKATAYQFMKFGYSQMMNKLPEARWILVNRNFPNLEN